MPVKKAKFHDTVSVPGRAWKVHRRSAWVAIIARGCTAMALEARPHDGALTDRLIS